MEKKYSESLVLKTDLKQNHWIFTIFFFILENVIDVNFLCSKVVDSWKAISKCLDIDINYIEIHSQSCKNEILK